MNETPEGLESETPKTQEAPPVAQAQAAIPVGELSAALAGAYRQIMAEQPRPQQHYQDPIDSLSASERETLTTEFITDPISAAKKVSNMGARAAENRMLQQAMPLIQTSANNIVEMFKMRKQRSDAYFNKIEPLFDRLMVGVDITPLVNMNEATRNSELEMRWKGARADILDVEMKKVKPEPTLLANGGGNQTQSLKLEDDPWLANMKREYGFTDAQVKEIMGTE